MNKKYLRFLWMLVPLAPAPVFFSIRGFLFSGLICVGISLIVGLFCLLSLFSGHTAKGLRLTLMIFLILGILLAGATEVIILSGSQGDSGVSPYMVVLGAGVNGSTPSLMLQNRIDAAAAYLKMHPDVICVVSGGQGDGENISEAACMFRELTAMGIPENQIWLEDQSTSTSQNIRNTLDLIERRTGSRPETLGIVSNEFHLARAKRMALDQDVTPIGIPAETSWVSLKINYYLREIPALWKYLILGGN